MSRTETVNTETVISFPRVSGDEPPNEGVSAALVGFSPRERG